MRGLVCALALVGLAHAAGADGVPPAQRIAELARELGRELPRVAAVQPLERGGVGTVLAVTEAGGLQRLSFDLAESEPPTLGAEGRLDETALVWRGEHLLLGTRQIAVARIAEELEALLKGAPKGVRRVVRLETTPETTYAELVGASAAALGAAAIHPERAGIPFVRYSAKGIRGRAEWKAELDHVVPQADRDVLLLIDRRMPAGVYLSLLLELATRNVTRIGMLACTKDEPVGVVPCYIPVDQGIGPHEVEEPSVDDPREEPVR